jgi:hypothetical protein
MARIVVDVVGKVHSYRVVFGKDAHYKISEHDLATGWGGAFRITRGPVDAILAATGSTQLQIAAAVYHQARLKRKARRTARAGGSHELVSTM